MLKILQKVTFFQISKFQAAAKAMKQSNKEPWLEKLSKGQKNQLWALYKQATQGDIKPQYQQKQQKPLSESKTTSQRVKASIKHQHEQFDAWSKYKGKSREQAENEYVKMARELLTKHKAEKYIKDF